MTTVKIDTTPDASVTEQDLAMRNTQGVWAGVGMNGNSWQADLPSGTYYFEHHIQGPDQASCGVTVSVGGSVVKTIDKTQHVVSAAAGELGDDILSFQVVVA